MNVRRSLLIGMFLLPAALLSEEQPGDMKIDPSKWINYDKANAAKIEVLSSAPDSSLVKVTTPGKGKLEGITMEAKVAANSRHVASCKIKGDGTVMLCVHRKNGWVYGEKTPLTADWREFRLEFFSEADGVMSAIITLADNPQKASFEVSGFKIETAAQAKEMAKVEIEPTLLEAENFPGQTAAGTTVQDGSASGGACVEGKRYFILAENVPLPQTELPVHIYLRAKSGGENLRDILLSVKSGGSLEIIGKAELPSAGAWAWVKTDGLSQKAGKCFLVSMNGSDTEAAGRLDALVVSTNGNLSDAELDKLMGGK